MEDQISDQKTVLGCISCLLYGWSKASQRPLISERLHNPVGGGGSDPIRGSVTGSLDLSVQSIVSMSFVEFLHVGGKKIKSYLLPKVVICPVKGQGLIFAFCFIETMLAFCTPLTQEGGFTTRST